MDEYMERIQMTYTQIKNDTNEYLEFDTKVNWGFLKYNCFCF